MGRGSGGLSALGAGVLPGTQIAGFIGFFAFALNGMMGRAVVSGVVMAASGLLWYPLLRRYFTATGIDPDGASIFHALSPSFFRFYLRDRAVWIAAGYTYSMAALLVGAALFLFVHALVARL